MCLRAISIHVYTYIKFGSYIFSNPRHIAIYITYTVNQIYFYMISGRGNLPCVKLQTPFFYFTHRQSDTHKRPLFSSFYNHAIIVTTPKSFFIPASRVFSETQCACASLLPRMRRFVNQIVPKATYLKHAHHYCQFLLFVFHPTHIGCIYLKLFYFFLFKYRLFISEYQ